MATIKPFKTVFYNPAKVNDLSQVVCPPYDVISADQQDALYKRNPNNFIRLCLTKGEAADNDTSNRYTRAKTTYDQWLKEKVLIQDEKPCLYYYKQEYKVLGQRYSRMGFIALMRIADDSKTKVHPHEKTHKAAKEDRFKLWKILKSNLSCIFVCFSDTQRKVETTFTKKIAMTEPFMDVTDADQVRHVIWRLEDPVLIDEISQTLDNQQLFIADGHHRFEVSKQLRDALAAEEGGTVSGDEPYNYVMTYFTNMDSRDLQIFPMHRILKKFPTDLEFLEEFFRIDNVRTKEDMVIMLAKAGKNEHAFGLYTRDGMKLLRLKNKMLIDEHIHEGSKDYRNLDATILKHFVFDKIGAISDDIVYTKDLEETMSMVQQGEAEASFIMNPVKIEQLKAIALNGERMPPKTTYFYPKVLSGLTAYKMD